MRTSSATRAIREFRTRGISKTPFPDAQRRRRTRPRFARAGGEFPPRRPNGRKQHGETIQRTTSKTGLSSSRMIQRRNGARLNWEHRRRRGRELRCAGDGARGESTRGVSVRFGIIDMLNAMATSISFFPCSEAIGRGDREAPLIRLSQSTKPSKNHLTRLSTKNCDFYSFIATVKNCLEFPPILRKTCRSNGANHAFSTTPPNGDGDA